MSDDIGKVAESLRVIREDEAAELLCIHVQTLRLWRRNGTGPKHIQLGQKRLGYRIGDIVAWQEARQRKATPRQAAAAMRAYFGDGEAA